MKTFLTALVLTVYTLISASGAVLPESLPSRAQPSPEFCAEYHEPAYSTPDIAVIIVYYEAENSCIAFYVPLNETAYRRLLRNIQSPTGLDLKSWQRAIGHHKIPFAEFRTGFSKAAEEFFNNPKGPAMVPTTPNGHNFTRHGYYNKVVRGRMLEWFRKTRIKPSAMTSKDASKLLRYVEADDFVKGFNNAVPGGPSKVAQWFGRTGYKLLCQATIRNKP